MYRYSLNTIFTAVGDYQASVTHTLAHQLFQKTLAQIGSHHKPQDHLVQCFISYAWASADALPNSPEKAHEVYAEKIALDLKTAGFRVLFDKWHDRAGKDINDFVEKILDESTDFILVLGTELYLKKYQKRNELSQNKNHVVRAESKLLNYLVTFNDQHSERVIPLLLEGTATQSLPPLLRPKIPVFLTENYFDGMFKLIRDLYKIDQQDQTFKQITAHFIEQLEIINQSVTNEMPADYEARLQSQAKDNTITTQEEVNGVLTALLSTSLILGKINDYNPYPHTVLTTWIMAIEELTKEYPEAIILLNHLAYLAPQIRRVDLNSWLKLFNDEASLDRAIEGLSQYSLVSIRQIDQKDSLVFHRLVQAVTREQQSPLEQKEYYQYAVQSVYEQVKVDDADWNNPVYWPCLVAMLEHAQQLLTPPPHIEINLWNLGRVCDQQHYFSEAEQFIQQALMIQKSVFGETHPVTHQTQIYLNEIQARRRRVNGQEFFAQRTDSSIPGSKNKYTLENGKKL